MMKLYIKYMVSPRCIQRVEEELHKLEIGYVAIGLSEVDIVENLTQKKHDALSHNLQSFGLELIENPKDLLVERIKILIIEMIHYSDKLPVVNFSHFLSEKLGYDYKYLSNLFSEIKGISIQHYIILNRVERIKELLLYDEMNLSEISLKLQYSSVAHLSNQFRKITGMSPSFYKRLKGTHRRLLENL